MATRRESVTCTMVDNGVIDETGGLLSAAAGGGRWTKTRLLRVLEDHLAAVHAPGIVKDEVDG
ncbi:MAG TPA: hypothetical protein VF279_02410 [Acidimicrobiales bacterium]